MQQSLKDVILIKMQRNKAEIIFENDQFVAVNKLAGMLTIPAISTEDAMKKFEKGVKIIKPYLRYTPQPNLN